MGLGGLGLDAGKEESPAPASERQRQLIRPPERSGQERVKTRVSKHKEGSWELQQVGSVAASTSLVLTPSHQARATRPQDHLLARVGGEALVPQTGKKCCTSRTTPKPG